MMRFPSALLALVVIAGLLVSISVEDARAQGSVESDRAALVALYNATGGANWTDNTKWLTDAPLGEWFGVETNEHGRVTGLRLGDWDQSLGEYVGNGLTGLLPPELGTLDQLQFLQIQGNAGLTGPIPSALGSLAGLTHLRLAGNGLAGAVPASVGDLAALEWAHLDSNRFTGEIPAALGNLSGLRWLSLNGNDLTGPIPAELGNSTNLGVLWLNDNALTGPIPVRWVT